VHAAGERINLPTTTLTTFMETLDYLAELEEAGIGDLLRHHRPYASPFHEHPAPVAFDLLRAVVDAALIGAMADAEIPQQYRLRLLSRFGGRLLLATRSDSPPL
jgi:hypothetical protein